MMNDKQIEQMPWHEATGMTRIHWFLLGVGVGFLIGGGIFDFWSSLP